MSLLALMWIELIGLATVASASQSKYQNTTLAIGFSIMIAGLLI